MTRVPRTLAGHKLGVKEGTLVVRQNKSGQSLEKSKVITEEVQKQVEAGIMREVTYHSWISNPVLLVDKAFDRQIGRNLEVYVEDLFIKNHSEKEVVTDIEETFRTLRKINMKLNPKKCTFEAVEGMFMGHAISKDGIQACSEKTQAVIDMPSPQTLKEVQSLNGKLTSLNRFLSKSAENSLPFFKILKRCIKKSDFAWTKEVEKALKDMKKQMAELPTLTTPIEGETLIMYLSVAKVVSSYLQNGGTSKCQFTLWEWHCNYQKSIILPMEKLILDLVHAARRLRMYF
ncbi:hypothetical protein Tco_1141495 [Tanacetum coccineum]